MAKKILVVDDEEDIRGAVKAVLENAGFSVTTLSGGSEALEHLKKSANFDLVLIDFFMPGMSGRKLIENIRADKSLKDIRCAFLTVANFSEKGLAKLDKLYALDYIKKPFENEELVKRVKNLVS